MYDMNTILKAMAEGKTADDLAKEFSDALNAAIAEDKRIKEEEFNAAEARRIAAAARKERIDALRKIIEAGRDYVKRYHAEGIPAEVLEAEIDDETVDALIDEISGYFEILPMLLKIADLGSVRTSFSAIPVKNTKPKAKKPSVDTLSKNEAEDILSQFLASLDFI